MRVVTYSLLKTSVKSAGKFIEIPCSVIKGFKKTRTQQIVEYKTNFLTVPLRESNPIIYHFFQIPTLEAGSFVRKSNPTCLLLLIALPFQVAYLPSIELPLRHISLMYVLVVHYFLVSAAVEIVEKKICQNDIRAHFTDIKKL